MPDYGCINCNFNTKNKNEINLLKIGGRLGIFVNTYKIIVNEKNKIPIKLKDLNKKNYGKMDQYWINDRYLKKYDEVPLDHIKKILSVVNVGSGFAVRKMSDVILKEKPLFLTYINPPSLFPGALGVELCSSLI